MVDHPNNEWIVTAHYTHDGIEENPFLTPDPDPDDGYPVRVVCYCDKKGSGYYYEATWAPYGTEATEIIGNSVLEHKYGIAATK